MEGSREIRLGIEQFFWRLMAWLQEVAELGGKSQAFRLQSGSLTDMFLVVLANASVSDPIAILSTRALATSDSQRGSFGSTTLGCTLAGLGGLLYLFLLLPTWVDRGRSGVGWGGVVGWGMLTLVWSCIGCARYVGHRVGWGGVGRVDVGLKLHRMCTLRWT